MRLKNKKILSLILVGLVSSSVMVGCSKDKEEEVSNNQNQVVEDLNADKEEEKEEETQEEDTNEDIETKELTLYVADIDNDDLKTIDVQVDKQFDEYALLSLLKQNDNTINKNTKLNSFDKTEKDGEVIITIDISKDIYPKNVGSSEEILMIDALTKSYLNAFNADKLQIKVDGGLYESNHICLEEDYMFEVTKTFSLRSLNQ